MNNEIIFLGTGNAIVTQCFNTCFIIRNSSRRMLMVDAGGGVAASCLMLYAEEAKSEYHGNVFVPNDLERINL